MRGPFARLRDATLNEAVFNFGAIAAKCNVGIIGQLPISPHITPITRRGRDNARHAKNMIWTGGKRHPASQAAQARFSFTPRRTRISCPSRMIRSRALPESLHQTPKKAENSATTAINNRETAKHEHEQSHAVCHRTKRSKHTGSIWLSKRIDSNKNQGRL